MFGIELLNNTGIQFIGNKSSLEQEEKTLVVVGIARGGTSLVAGTLHHLGVFTGDRSRPPVFEDVRLAEAFEKGDFQEAKLIIDDYNEKYKQWSFKRPAAINYIDKLHSMCRNPIYLFIFKDIFAVSNRNNISMKSDVVSGLKKAHDDYAKVVNFISNNDLNGFFFSYEKVMANKDAFVDVLVDVVGKKNVSEEQKLSALTFIEPNPKEYLNASRVTRGQGQIGSVEETKVIGWAKYVHSHKPGTVELYVNNELVATAIAKDFRQGALDNNIHPTGHCGYMFDLTNSPLKEGDIVSVKLEDEVNFLNNSNQVFKL